ncbi:MAG TPA: cation-efflux pump [Verrucomicrobiae bacterium]|jgi:cation diffusion facilitator family transporter|nr:cation-efflux pump [Verrucomicrobiae bacterium]
MSDSTRSAEMQREKKAVALNSILAAVGITALKVVVGVATGSLGILSEAAHSGLDLVAAAVTYFSVRVSDKPADAEHQYGHGKIESFSAFVETGLLLLTCVWIVYEAGKRLFFHSVEIEPSVWAFVVMGVSIVVDSWRSRRLQRIAEKYDSQALQADALHFSTDIWSSSVVILGLALVMLGRKYQLHWLAKADPIAALFVACIVVYVSSRLALQTVDTLLDAAPAGIRSRIIEAVFKVDGVLEIDRVRIRRSGSRYFADVSIAMSRNVTFQKSEQIANEVSAQIRALLPEADVVVNAVSRASRQESLFDQIRAVATRNNLNVHDISVQDIGGKLHVEQHVELDERLSLKEAHDRVTRLELEMKQEVKQISDILTHIESEPATIETTDELLRAPSFEERLQAVTEGFPEVVDMHDLMFKRVAGRLYLSAHITMQDDLPLSRVHDIQTAVEGRFRQEVPELFRVLIHPEPTTDNRR